MFFSGSTASTGSESDCQSLHAGVCAKARDIPTKDCNIAREALEILITCLQIRCELIGRFIMCAGCFKTSDIQKTCFFGRLQLSPSVVFKGHSVNNDMNVILGFKIFYTSSCTYIWKYFCWKDLCTLACNVYVWFATECVMDWYKVYSTVIIVHCYSLFLFPALQQWFYHWYFGGLH